MTSEFYYKPSESIYQHYAWANNGKVSLCNDSDGEYEQVFANREEFQRFVDHLMAVADEAWPRVDEHGYPLQLGDFCAS
jgi:hypothetical protein